jgi:hypothetical protein
MLVAVCLAIPPLARGHNPALSFLENTELIVYPETGERVDSTVAVNLQSTLARGAMVKSVESSDPSQPGLVQVSIYGEGWDQEPASPPEDTGWMYVKLNSDGSGKLITSQKHLLYGLFSLLSEDSSTVTAEQLSNGYLIETPFRTVIGEDGFFGRRRHFSRGYDPEQSIRELARMGCSHVVANALPHPYPIEEGPEGEIYYRFYQYAADLDMYAATELNEGTYPPEIIKANVLFLRKQARLADAYGLTPGLYMANPRSMPASFWQDYPWLRGARVDHTFRAFRPRYNLTVAHPLVRWHYSELMKKVLKRVPELGFAVTLINDSGSGFEYTASLYPGRNGGPYIVREWRPDDVIAHKAAENVIRYYRTLRDAAHEINPDFRIITGLKNIAEEAEIILDGMDQGLDLKARTQRYDAKSQQKRKAELNARGSHLFTYAPATGSPYIKGVPSPWQAYQNLQLQIHQEAYHIELGTDPKSLAPWDINREVIRAVQLNTVKDVDTLISRVATSWAGKTLSPELVSIWKKVDRASQAAPDMGLYAASGFTWYRLWDRPLVPDIGKIPSEKRKYYEDYLLTVFNNPNNVDLQADALWDLYPVEDCEAYVRSYDTRVLVAVDSAIDQTVSVLKSLDTHDDVVDLFTDLRDRLKAYRYYLTTLRNTCAWIAGVHGYLNAPTDEIKQEKRNGVQKMVELELENTKKLLQLWRETDIVFMPIYRYGENGHDYGPNFGECLQKKIALMQEYGDHPPYIDPDYMWRLPEDTDLDIDPEEYLKY